MSLSARHLLVGAAALVACASAPTAASAAPVLANNACTAGDGSDGQWGTLPLELSATATQSGRNLNVSAIQPTVAIPSWLPAKIEPYGLLIAAAIGTGTKTVNVDAWMAVSGNGSTDAPQVVKTTGTLKFTLSTSNLVNYKVTNPSLTLKPTDATTWHAADAGGEVSVAQAPAGSLTATAGVPSSAKGSLWVKASLAGQSLTIDCQPGTTPDLQNLNSTFTPGAAPTIVSSVFAAAPVTPQAPDPIVPTPVSPTPSEPSTPTSTTTTPPQSTTTTPPQSTTTTPAGLLAVASPSLKFGSAAVLVNVSCPAGGKDCSGSAVITSAKKLRVGPGAAKLRKLAAGTFTVKAGTTAPIKLKLTADGKKLKKTALVADVTLKPASGAAVKKRLRAN